MRIAFFGASQCGKNECVNALVRANFYHLSMSQPAKQELDEIFSRRLGFSSFTGIPQEKKRIVPVLQHLMEACRDSYVAEAFQTATQHDLVALERIYDVAQCTKWKEVVGGHIIYVVRPGVNWLDEFEARTHSTVLTHAGELISCVLYNNGDKDNLHRATLEAVAQINEGHHSIQMSAKDY